MKTMVMKFGGSSVADDSKLRIVAHKIIDSKKVADNILVVVSAQGKTTNSLISESKILSATPNERELDMLLSVGEQITAAKLSILLNELGHKAISLTGWQAGIKTNSIYENARIEEICLERINNEFQNGNIVVVTGFQGINESGDITTLGRGGSDTTAVALAAALETDECYIFSDVDGIYSADPHIVNGAKKIDKISFDEMQEISDAGAKVLHNRSIQIGKKFNCSIVAKSTFSNSEGSTVCKKMETREIKCIVNNENLSLIKPAITGDEALELYKIFLLNNIVVFDFKKNEPYFLVSKSDIDKIQKIVDEKGYVLNINDICVLSIIGYGVIQDNNVLSSAISVIEQETEILSINVSQCKIEIIAKNISDEMLNNLHKQLIEV